MSLNWGKLFIYICKLGKTRAERKHMSIGFLNIIKEKSIVASKS